MRMFNKTSIKKGLLACVALMAVMALLLCGCGQNTKKADKKDPGSKTEPSKDVVISTGLVEQATAMYGDILSLYKNVLSGDSKLYTSSDMRLVLGDDVKDLIADLLDAEGIDDADALMDIADGITIGMDSGLQGNLMEMVLRLGHTDDSGDVTDIIDLDVIADFGEGDLYMGIPSLLKGYITTSIDVMDMEAAMDDLMEQWIELEAQLAELEEVLPSEELVGTLLAKYVGIVMDQLDSKETVKTVTANGVEEKFTVSEIQIYQKDLYDIAIAVLKEVKKDSHIEEWLEDVAAHFEVDEDVFGAFVDSVDLLIEELADFDDFDTDSHLDLALYLNSADALVGMDISFTEDGDSEQFVHFLTAVAGDTFGFELNVYDMVEVLGTGTDNKGITDATFDVKVEDQDILQIKVIGYDGANGTFRFVPSADLLADAMGDLPSEIAAFVSLMDLGLQIEVKSDDDKGEFGLYLVDDDEILIGLAIATEITEKEIKVPSSNVYTEDEAMEWLASLDGEKLLKALRNIGVPDDLCDELESALSLLELGSQLVPGLGGDYDDFFSDYEDIFGDFDYGDYEDILGDFEFTL